MPLPNWGKIVKTARQIQKSAIPARAKPTSTGNNVSKNGWNNGRVATVEYVPKTTASWAKQAAANVQAQRQTAWNKFSNAVTGSSTVSQPQQAQQARNAPGSSNRTSLLFGPFRPGENTGLGKTQPVANPGGYSGYGSSSYGSGGGSGYSSGGGASLDVPQWYLDMLSWRI